MPKSHHADRDPQSLQPLEPRRLMTGDAVSLPYRLDFDADAGGLGDAAGTGTGFTGVQANLNAAPDYDADALGVAGGLLRLAADADAGSNHRGANSLKNALQVRFDARGGFVAEARIVGEGGGTLGQLDSLYQQAGLFVGPGQDRFAKLVAIHHDGGSRLQFAGEWTDGSGGFASDAATVHAGDWAAVRALDLRVTGNAGAGTLAAEFRTDGGAWRSVPNAIVVPAEHRAAVFAADAVAGILAFHAAGPSAAFAVNFDHFQVRRAEAHAGPSVAAVRPGAGATDVGRDAFVAVDVSLPNGAIDGATVGPQTVYLLDSATNAAVPAAVTVSGGGDAITLTPRELLAADRTYTLVVTAGVRDVSGAPFDAFTASFTTGDSVAASEPRVAFDRAVQGETVGLGWTGLAFGPDGRLYGTTADGQVHRFDVAADGTLGNRTLLFDFLAETGERRLVTGLTFDPDADTPTAYLSHGAYVDPGDETNRDAPEWSGKITRLAGPDLGTATDVVVGLPRSVYDHLNNQPAFGPDGRLYWTQPSNTAMGDPDRTWGWRPERLLSAAVLSADVRSISSTLSVRTEGPDAYDPYAQGAPVTIHATGVRNAYDLVFTAGGHLFLPANGSAAGGNAPGAGRVGDTQHDYLFRVEAGGYYGHPNPLRGETVLNGGNPTAGRDVAEVSEYPVGTRPDPNYRGFAHDFGLNVSPNGVLQYDSGGSHFGGALDGKLVVVRYSGGDDLMFLDVDEATGEVRGTSIGSFGTGGFIDPLDVVQDPATGNLYVVEAGFRSGGTLQVSLLTPLAAGAEARVDLDARDYGGGPTLHLSGVAGTPGVGQPVTVTNDGSGPLAFPADAVQVSGPDAARFRVVGLPANLPTLAPGESLTFTVEHIAGEAGEISNATLTLRTNDLDDAIRSYRLRGLGTAGEGGDLEPSLQRILDLYGLSTNVGDPDPDTTDYPSRSVVPGSDEVLAQLLRPSGAGPVTVELLASMGTANAKAHADTSALGFYADGDAGSVTELFRIDKAFAQTVGVVPRGSFAFSPGGDFGLAATFFDFGPRTVYQQDGLNTWESDDGERRKLRLFPLRDAAGDVVPDAFVFAFEEWDVRSDQNDLVGIIRGVRVAGLTPGVEVVNAEHAVFGTHLAMSRIEHLDPYLPNKVRDTATLLVRNGGDAPLQITGVTLDSDHFEIVSGGGDGAVAPGGVREIVVRFVYSDPTLRSTYGDGDADPNEAEDDNRAISRLVKTGTLTVTTNDPAAPTRTATLGGLWQSHSEEGGTGTSQEPSLNEIVAVFGWQIDVGPNTGQGNYGTGQNTGGARVAIGQETLSDYWHKAGPGDVEVIQLAAYHQQRDPQWTGTGSPAYKPNTSFHWHRESDSKGQYKRVFKHDLDFGQSILPLIDGESGTSAGRFDPGGEAFAVSVDKGWHSDHTRNKNDLHSFRFFAVRDAAGNVIPNAYLAASDNVGSSFANYDHQDNVYLLLNVRPAEGPSAPAGLSAGGTENGVGLAWDANREGNLAGYHVERADSSGGPFARLTDAPLDASAFTDVTATPGVTYRYRVVAVDYHGTQGTAATATATRPAGASAPAQPTDLAAVAAGHGRVELTWVDNAASETGYRVERSAGSGAYATIVMLPADATEYADTNAAGATAYRYRVVAFNAAGDSPPSNPADATTPPDLTAPANVAATADAHDRATVTWTDLSDDESGFRVERATAGGGFVAIGEVAANVGSFTDAGVAPETSYVYRVVPVAGDSSGKASNTAAVTTPRDPADVAAPTGLRVAAAGPYGVTVAWDHASGATGFEVQRAHGDGGFQSFTTAGTTYSDAAQPEATYRFRVRALSGSYTSDFTHILTVTTPADQSKLDAPANLVATAPVHTQVDLTWADVRFETRYLLQRRADGGAFETVATLGEGATGYLDTGLAAATAYEYRVAAANGLNPRGPWSAVAAVTTPSADRHVSSDLGDAAGETAVLTPGRDVNLTASGTTLGTADDVRLLHRPVVGDFDVVVRLDSFDKASPASAAGLMAREDLSPSGRNVFLRASGDAALSYRSAFGADTSNTAAVPTGVPVHLRLARVGDSFTGYWSADGVAWNAVGSVTLDLPATLRLGPALTSYSADPATARFRGLGSYEQQRPAAPTGLTVTPQGTASVALRWQDAAGNESGYRVERRTGGGDWIAVATLPDDAAAYTDAGVLAGTTYEYRVVAFNAAGDAAGETVRVEIASDVPSSPETARPPPPPTARSHGPRRRATLSATALNAASPAAAGGRSPTSRPTRPASATTPPRRASTSTASSPSDATARARRRRPSRSSWTGSTPSADPT